MALLERENQRLRERNSAEVEHKYVERRERREKEKNRVQIIKLFHRLSELTHQLEDANKLNEMLKKELEKGG